MSTAVLRAGLRYTGVTIRCVIKRIRLFGTLVPDSKLRQNQAPQLVTHLQPSWGGAEQCQNRNITLIHAAVFDWLRATLAGAATASGAKIWVQ
jgi:hypothetical protein